VRDDVVRARELQRKPLANDRVDADFGLGGQLRLEKPVAEVLLGEAAARAERERLELIGEVGASTGRAAGDARLELGDRRLERPPGFLAHAPRSAHAVV